MFILCMYRECSKMSLYIQASSFSDQFESVPAAYSKSIKAFIPIITLSVLHPCPLQEGLLAAAGGSAGGRASAPAALVALASAAARPRRPRWPPLQRSTLLQNGRSVGKTSPTVLTIYRAAMDLSSSRMCCGDVDVATKIGHKRYYFSVILCSNNQQLLKHNDLKLCGNHDVT